ncbi:MAG TPA: hypothetical protein ACFCUY_16840, partial [Xenococcaceae cyanobacterium]
AERQTDGASGFFVQNTVDGLVNNTILFDIGNPNNLEADSNSLDVGQANLLVAPEFAGILQFGGLASEDLTGSDVGDAVINATTNNPPADDDMDNPPSDDSDDSDDDMDNPPNPPVDDMDNPPSDDSDDSDDDMDNPPSDDSDDGSQSIIQDGTTSVALDTELLQTAAGLNLTGTNGTEEPVSEQFAVGFDITEESDFAYNQQDGFTPVAGEIEHTGTVTFNSEIGEITVGNFRIGFNAERQTDNTSGFFVQNTVDGAVAAGTILFDVSNPDSLEADSDSLDVGQSDLLVAPEFAEILQDNNLASDNLTGADVGDAVINATTDINDDPDLDTDIFRFRRLGDPISSYLYAAEEEAESIRANFSDTFEEEGLAFKVGVEPDDDLIALYRFQSLNNPGRYLYVGEEERASINANFSESFTEEGLAFYVYGVGAEEATEFSRFRNLNLADTYLYATGEEAESIRNNFADTFVEEGPAFEVEI